MYKYRSKNGAVKLNSARKDTDTDVSICTDMSQFACNNWNRRNLLIASIWCQKPLHPYIPQKNVMDPWPAPYQNNNDYWCFNYDQKTSGSNVLHTSVISNVSTQCYTRGPYKEGELQTSPRCCFHCPAMLHPLLGGESIGLFNDVFTPVHRQRQIPTLLDIVRYHDWVHSAIPLSTTPKANSTTAAQIKTGQPSFHIQKALAPKWGILLNTEDFSSLNPWPAPDHSSNDYWCFTYDH